MTRRTVLAWAWVHKWSSLVATAFLLMLCLTGLPLIFHEEIDAATGGRAPLAVLPEGTPPKSLDVLLAIALATRPGEVPLYMSFDTDRPVVNITTGPVPDAAEAAMHFLSLDARSGAILPAATEGGVMHVLLELHTDMLLGLPGKLFLGAMGLLCVIAIVSGIVLYAPFMRRFGFGTVRRDHGARAKWLDVHNLFGIVTIAWLAVVALTGTINTLSEQITNAWKADQLAAMVAPFAGQPVPADFSSVQAAVELAEARAPGMRPQFIAFPGVAFSSTHHFGVFMQGRTPLTAKLLTPVLIEAETGRFADMRPMPWYMQGLLLSQPLHFGDYGGLAMKLLWAALDLVTIVVLGSGLYLWIGRRRRTLRPVPA
jgi:uncharacterized iron-regulated membrane protein